MTLTLVSIFIAFESVVDDIQHLILVIPGFKNKVSLESICEVYKYTLDTKLLEENKNKY